MGTSNVHPRPGRPPRRRVAVPLVLLAAGLAASCATSRVAPTPARPPRGAETPPHAPGEGDAARAVLDAHNAIRAARHLGPLAANAELDAAARAHADDMARRRKMSHRGGDGSSPFSRIERAGYSFKGAAENVAFGFDDVAAVMDGWMRSAGHRRNILGPYREAGVGRAVDATGAAYWCVTFGTPAARDSRPVAARGVDFR